MEKLLNYAEGRFAIFDTGLFYNREKKKNKKSLILKVDLEDPP